ncbi:alpha/beta fold hydrolase [Rhodococcus opacus]|nr:alpha/beta fold hydrolase [Rhodococcus opacus]
MTRSIAAGWAGYLGGLSARDVELVDIIRDGRKFWRAYTAKGTPQWAHPNAIRAQWPLARLRDYSVRSPESVVPTLVLPPQSGHTSCVVDYSRSRSQMMVMRAAGLTNLHCLDWRPATRGTRDTGVEDYLAIVDESIDPLGGGANVVGDSQGGWLAVIYAALHREKVHTLTIGGAPVDFHAALGMGQTHENTVGRVLFWLARLSVISGRGLHRGAVQAWGIRLFDPLSEVDRVMRLWAGIDDPDVIDRYTALNRWLHTPQDMPGRMFLWTVRHLFVNNELIKGELRVDGRIVELAAIDCPLFLLAGRNDPAAPPTQVWALAERVSTPPEMIVREEANAGHLQLFLSNAVLQNHGRRS